MRHQKFVYDEVRGEGEYVLLTPEEIEKLENKMSSLGKFSKRAVLLKDYKG